MHTYISQAAISVPKLRKRNGISSDSIKQQ